MVTSETVARSGDTGRIAGTTLGVLSGAQVGFAAIPIPVVGTLLGAVLGAMLGGESGRLLGRAVMKVAGVVVNAGALLVQPVASQVAQTVEKPAADLPKKGS